MSSFHLHFERKSQIFDLDFQESNHASKDTVQINGRSFILLGNSAQVAWLQSKLPELKNQTGFTEEGLQQRLISLGAKNVSTAVKAHSFGIDALQQEKPEKPDPAKELQSALSQLEKLEWAAIEKLMDALPMTDPEMRKSMLRDAAFALRDEKPKTSEFVLKKLVETSIIPLMEKTGPATKPTTIQDRMRELGIKGCSIAVVDTTKKGMRTLWSQGFGEMDAKDVKAQAASCSKTIAALTVLTLVDEGKLALDTDVSTIIPKELWEKIDPEHLAEGKSHKVTIRRLLSHTACISVGGFSGYPKPEDAPKETKEIILGKDTRSPPIRVVEPPGQGFHYSGGGTTILQLVVEEITGKHFWEAAEERVLKKLGMGSSSYSPQQEKAVSGYGIDGNEIEGGWHVYPEHAAAGLWSTAEDLAKVVAGIQHAFNGGSQAIISQKLAKEMLTPQIEGRGAPNGLGIFVDMLPESMVFHHPGENQGYRCILLGNGNGQGVAIMVNSDNGKFLWKEIVTTVAEIYKWKEKDHLLMAKPVIQPEEIDKTPPEPKTWGEMHKGSYYLPDPQATVKFNIFVQEGKVFGQIDQESPFEIFPLSASAACYRRFNPGPWEVLRIDEQGGIEFAGDKWAGKWKTKENASIEENRKLLAEKYWSKVIEPRQKKIAKAEKHLARLKLQAARTKKGKAGRSKRAALNEQIKIEEERIAALQKQEALPLLDFLKSQSPKPQEVEAAFNKAISDHNIGLFFSLFESLSARQLIQIERGEGLGAIPLATLTDLPAILTEENLQDIREYMRDTQFSGVIAISQGKSQQHILSSAGIVDPEVPFAIHSVGKVFTGVLVLRLIEEGILSEDVLKEPIQLDEEVIEALSPEVRRQLSNTSLQQVMLHQGRYGDYLGNYQDAIEEAIREGKAVPRIEKPEDFLQFADKKLVKLGPSGDAYSNLGLLLVGLSLQHLTKKSYEELLQEYVLKPAGVKTFETEKPEQGYVNPDDPVAPHIAGGPAGGYWTSCTDLLRMGMWLKEKCQSPEFLQLMEKSGGEFYQNGEIAHGGSILSSSAHLSCRLKNGLTIAIMCNKAGLGEASGLSQAIQDNILSPETQIDSYLKSLEQSIHFSGSVLVKKGGKEILSKAYGQAAESSQNTPETAFQIMSLSKQFTAAAIFKLLEAIEVKEDRKIDIATEKIFNYLPERFRSEKLKDITFKQLLTHTSGLINNIGDPLDKEQKFEAARTRSLSEGKPFEPTPDELISYFIDNPIREEYAGKPHYSNNGYFLLGAIIEHVSGEKYGDFIKNHLLPEGMRSTGYYNDNRTKALPKAEGFGLDQEKESLKQETSRVAGEAFSAGGLYSTPRDLALWSENLLGGKIISGEHLRLMTERQDAEDFSCGLEIREIGGKEAIFQGGTLPGGGYKAEMCLFKDSQDAVILLLNNFDVPIEHVRNTLFGILNNDLATVTILKPTDPAPPFATEGKGEFNTKEKTAPHKFLKEESQFFVIGPNGEKDRLVPLSNGRFLNLRYGVQWEFKEDRAIFHPREGNPIALPRNSV